MGYSCPVCETPQHDSEHLANHLAMTAMLHEADHEAWLDEHVEEWAELAPPELGKRVVDAAERVNYDQAAVEAADAPEEFREEAEGSHDHQHASHATDHGHVPDAGGVEESVIRGADQLDEETEEVLAEARELTRKRRAAAAEEENGEEAGDDPSGGEADANGDDE